MHVGTRSRRNFRGREPNSKESTPFAAVQADTPESGAHKVDPAAQFAELRQMIEALGAREKTPAVAPLTESKVGNAVPLAKQGATIQDLVQCCGLNAGEAQLFAAAARVPGEAERRRLIGRVTRISPAGS